MDTPILIFWPPELQENEFLLFEASSVCGLLLRQCQETDTGPKRRCNQKTPNRPGTKLTSDFDSQGVGNSPRETGLRGTK